jgi:anhydro-N-acetylmuramic acid kinase
MRYPVVMITMSKTTRIFAGCMTGTSLDGLDIAIVEISGTGLEMSARLLEQGSFSLGSMIERLRELAEDKLVPPSKILRLQREFGQFHADCLSEMTHAKQLDAVVCHGQTIRHLPDEHLSWQLFDPWPIAHQLHVPVCYDLRQADLIAGGNGAPVTPMSDWILYRDATSPRWIVNLGGICNITYLPQADCENALQHIRGMDIGPCNLLLDGLVQQLFPNVRFDEDGIRASQGQCQSDLLPVIEQAPFFKRPLPRTTGREDFDFHWVTSFIKQTQDKPCDLLHAAVDATARLLAKQVNDTDNAQLILAGGGSRHPLLVEKIREHVRQPVLISDELGIDVSMREAMGFAVLGALSQDGIPITLPQITGANLPGMSPGAGVAGAWVGGR